MSIDFIFTLVITLQLTLMTGAVAYFDTMHTKDRQRNKKREDFGGIS